MFLISAKGINLHQKHLKPNGIQAHETLSCTEWWTVKVLIEQDVTSAKSIQNIMGFKSGMKVAFSRLDFSTTVQETLQYIHALHTYILCKKWSNVLESFFTAAPMYKKQSVRIPFISYCFTSLLARKLSLHVLAGPGIKQGSVNRLNILNMQVQGL